MDYDNALGTVRFDSLASAHSSGVASQNNYVSHEENAIKRIAIPSLALAVLIATGLAMAAPDPAVNEPKAESRFGVAMGGGTGVLVERSTGRTWVLHHYADAIENSVWLPIERLDGAEAERWRADQPLRVRLASYRAQLNTLNEGGLRSVQAGIVKELEEKIAALEAELAN